MSYRFFVNSGRDFYDYTMDKILKAVDEDERGLSEITYTAQIISGDSLGGDTTTPQENVKYVNLNGKVAMAFKIRFTEKSSKYNFVENPFPESASVAYTDSERQLLVSMHDDAYLQAGGIPTIPKFGDIVVCKKFDGRIFIIEKVLTNRNILFDLLAKANLSNLFGNNSLLGLSGGGGTGNNVGVTGNGARFSLKTSAIDSKTGKVCRPYVRTYIGPRVEWQNKDIENGVFLTGFHEKVPDDIVDPSGAKNPTFIQDVIQDFVNLAKAFEQQFGKKLKVSDHFRSWKGQLDVRKRKPNLSAVPGTSNHGWGIAFDWDTTWKGVKGFKSETYIWMFQNAPNFNFWNPEWARQGGSKPESWHFEYLKPGILFKR